MSRPALDQLLADVLPGRRWFGGKGRVIEAVTVESEMTLPDCPVECRLVVAAVRYADGEVERYQVPVGLLRGDAEQRGASLGPTAFGEVDVDGPAFAFDGLVDPDIGQALLTIAAEQATVGPLTGRRIAAIEPMPGRLLTGEQSNSSVVYADHAILKAYRQLREGLNPDLEVLLALTEVGCPHIAPVLGWIETTEPFPATLGLVQQFLRSGTDGWVSAAASVRDLYAERDLHADEVGGDFAAESHRIGQIIAALHADLARALPTGEARGSDHHDLAADLHARLDAASAVAPALAERREAIAAAYDEVGGLETAVPLQRVHGDLHLGQLLRVDSGWVVLDFEGEPARSLDERRALMSPLRDVAGMLRSFDYAARHLLAEQPGRPDLDYRAAEWADRNREAFCDGYAETSSHDPRKDAVLLRALELDKAVYETVYETRNRPHWLAIPLAGIDRVIGSVDGGGRRG